MNTHEIDPGFRSEDEEMRYVHEQENPPPQREKDAEHNPFLWQWLSE